MTDAERQRRENYEGHVPWLEKHPMAEQFRQDAAEDVAKNAAEEARMLDPAVQIARIRTVLDHLGKFQGNTGDARIPLSRHVGNVTTAVSALEDIIEERDMKIAILEALQVDLQTQRDGHRKRAGMLTKAIGELKTCVHIVDLEAAIEGMKQDAGNFRCRVREDAERIVADASTIVGLEAEMRVLRADRDEHRSHARMLTRAIDELKT